MNLAMTTTKTFPLKLAIQQEICRAFTVNELEILRPFEGKIRHCIELAIEKALIGDYYNNYI